MEAGERVWGVPVGPPPRRVVRRGLPGVGTGQQGGRCWDRRRALRSALAWPAWLQDGVLALLLVAVPTETTPRGKTTSTLQTGSLRGSVLGVGTGGQGPAFLVEQVI